ncbi:MAG TPA: 2-oxo acid dehydrogenase subunit E2 [Alkalispirochaeta sp.]|nr:2-oxo acid dehydrogenase subunit E2 [Alkalispirochaeta sp.]
MATKIIMPKQGLQMTEGNIIEWHYSEGDTVTEGEPLFEMETDKLTIDIDAPASGTLLKIIHGADAVVPITHTIGVIGESGEDIAAILEEAASQGGASEESEPEPQAAPQSAPPTASSAPPSSGASAASAASAAPPAAPAADPDRPRRPDGQVFSTPRARTVAVQRGVDIEAVAPSGPEDTVIERDILAAAESMPAATPLARKRADDMGVPLTSVAGSGPRGKVYDRDVSSVAGTGADRAVAAPTAPAGSFPEDRLIPLKGMRKIIAQRMRESLDTAAQAVHRLAVDMSETVRMRGKLKEAEIAVSYNDIVLKAVAKTLRAHPRMNSALTDEGILELGHVNIGVAVALEEGLIVPVIRDVDILSLEQIHAESRRLGEAARNGSLNPDETQGGSFSVSNLGMYGLDSFTAIIDTPESGILAVGAIKERVVPVNGEPVVRPVCELSLTYDHRVVDGAPAAEFLKTIGEILQNPYRLI